MTRRIDVRVGRSADEEGSFLAEVSGFAGGVVMDTPPSGTLWTGTEAPPGGDGEGDGEGDGNGGEK